MIMQVGIKGRVVTDSLSIVLLYPLRVHPSGKVASIKKWGSETLVPIILFLELGLPKKSARARKNLNLRFSNCLY